MPFYSYENEKTGEVIEVLQGMNDAHEYHGSNGSEKGLWKRLFTVPYSNSDTKVDPFSASSFRASTVGKNDTYGELFERSAEASAQRAEKNGGIDPIKQKQYADYSKMTNGKLHPQQMKENFNKAKEKASKAGINIEL